MMALVEHSHTRNTEKRVSDNTLYCPPGGYSVVRVITDNPSASGLTWAQSCGIDTVVLPEKSDFSSKQEYYAHFLDRVLEVQPALVCLAGFMKVLPPEFIGPLFPRIINIHPSLLPAFPGLNTHERALSAGVTAHGCSIHVVVPKVDAGPLIAQAAVNVEQHDTPQSLAGRVLEAEHRIYPWVVSMICTGNITLGDTVVFSESARADALSQGYLLPHN